MAFVNGSNSSDHKGSMRSSKSMGGSGTLQGTQVWVRTDLIEAIVNNRGTLPTGWKPRKRVRPSLNYEDSQQERGVVVDEYDYTSWGWCRATVCSASTPALSPDRQNENVNVAVDKNNPFSNVKLRKTTPNKAIDNKKTSWSGSPERISKTIHLTVTVDDIELAPQHIQNATVSFTYETSDSSYVCMANSMWQNGESSDNSVFDTCSAPEDLTTLEQLHEPAVVFCLQKRYEFDHIYTYTGKILLALNPFRPIDDIYSEETMQIYWNGGMNFRNNSNGLNESQNSENGSDVRRPPPHIYAIAEDAYRSMMRSLEQPITTNARKGQQHVGGQNQSVLVSGESGAGKTVTTKIILRYLATLSAEKQKSRSLLGYVSTIESQVLESNPILESFGNARTIRNDNSSRFGKFIEMQFDALGCLISASIETYLLEKVRLVSQSVGERNYHIFYEILAGLPSKDLEKFHIGRNDTAADFRMTALSGTYDRRDRVDDRDTYLELKNALNIVGFTDSEQNDLFHVVCALLHTSNLTFSEQDSADSSIIDQNNPAIVAATVLLGVDASDLNHALTKCAIVIRGETVHKTLSVDSAVKAVESFIKTTYGALFNFIVRKINNFVAIHRSTDNDQQTSSVQRQKTEQSGRTAAIGVLDIFGFESFDKNSFEQLCINYCNEALQQQFNRFVFKLEQQEYEKEGIEWSFIEFPDNQDVLDLIEKKHEGILSILDEQSRLPRCTDATFAAAVYTKLSNHKRFHATMTQKARLAFSVEHYAGLVEYDTEFFLEKNKDELPKETTELLMSSTYPFLARLGRDLTDSHQQTLQTNSNNRTPQRPAKHNTPIKTAGSLIWESVGVQFSSQLRTLRTRIEATEPHYVRCLKPNDKLIPYNFNHLVISDQLRCAGVLEAIRVSRIGFPQRYYHDHFVHRYALLRRSSIIVGGVNPTLKKVRTVSGPSKLHGREACEALINALIPDVSAALNDGIKGGISPVYSGMQLGKTKVFLRRRAFEALEYLRCKKLDEGATTIQSLFRMYCQRREYERVYMAILKIQDFVRAVEEYSRRRAETIHNAALIIQAFVRSYQPRRTLAAARWIACWCQSAYRGSIARQYCAYLFLHRNASIIQRTWRQYCLTLTFRKLRHAVISIQNKQRVHLAMQELRRLRCEARNLSTIAAERDKFREESRQLRQELEKAKASSSLSPMKPHTNKNHHKYPDRENEIHNLRNEVEMLRIELEKAHRMMTPTKRNNNNNVHDTNAKRLIEELADREDELDRLKKELDMLRLRDGSVTVATSHASEFSFRLPTRPTDTRHSFDRSETSLIDHCEGEEEEEDGGEYIITVDRGDDDNSSISGHDGRAGFLTGPGEMYFLHNAIRDGDYNRVEQILNTTFEVCVLLNQGDKFGRTAIHIAALSLNVAIAESLISRGAVVNAQDDDGETPLHLSENGFMTELLLTKGRANPNIPNVDGICALHLAVQRRDYDSAKVLIQCHANINAADNVRWFTSLHLIALPAGVNDSSTSTTGTNKVNATKGNGHNSNNNNDDENEHHSNGSSTIRMQIANLLTLANGRNGPDLNYQDSDGNTPLHYAVQVETIDCCDLVSLFLERGANPNIRNVRDQSPLHLLCHNTQLRKNCNNFQEIIHIMLMHHADPNIQSLTGCTPLHLTLYHQDIDTAVQLVHHGAQLHLIWKKPKRWPSFWKDMGSSRVVALDMVEQYDSLYRILSSITCPHTIPPYRSWCMQCKKIIVVSSKEKEKSQQQQQAYQHCMYCSRQLCTNCLVQQQLTMDYFPNNFHHLFVNEQTTTTRPCYICERILIAQKEIRTLSHTTKKKNNTTTKSASSASSAGASATTTSNNGNQYRKNKTKNNKNNNHHHHRNDNNNSEVDDDDDDTDEERFSC